MPRRRYLARRRLRRAPESHPHGSPMCEGGNSMHARRMLASALVIGLLMSSFAIGSAPAQVAGQNTRLIASGGTTSLQAAGQGSDAVQFPEFPGGDSEGDT